MRLWVEYVFSRYFPATTLSPIYHQSANRLSISEVLRSAVQRDVRKIEFFSVVIGSDDGAARFG